MIKTIILQTAEADDPETAVSGILAQLQKSELKRNSVGLISCFADFITSGVVAALAEKLPFPIAGTTTLAAAATGIQGEVLLIITVLTSDDVEFDVGITDPISAEDDKPLKAAWDRIAGKRADKPSLMLSFAPLLMNVSADFFVEAWTAITGNVPNFGTLAVDHNPDYHESQTILNKEASKDRYVFVLCYGKVDPLFFIAGIAEEEAFREKGIVTASQGNQLKGVNGVSVAQYLTSLGLEKDENGAIKGVNAYPFIQDYKDGTQPVIRVMFAITPDGSAVCGGKIPVGAELTVGFINAEGVLAFSEEALKKVVSKAADRSVLIFSCIGRYFSLGYEKNAEIDKTVQIMGDRHFHLSYSGTELCPVYGKDGKLTNRSHNDTMVICVL
ncbi:FIST C-terminal domain-containing protein [Leadbettera azotonutricia]|uniref:FIST domain-containing protein n=1 Tax=Leadbettera azotonutricia (strain ATCC BAA-888 / DSM 13862 / ZAS-9) TaxID=545695 RepID=F5Y8Q9_LEAAZ|nr:FIST N-terminal domain-containing protein [Leadbettera azotonutricia]AEF83236.1 hypothetical protein TREAZ_2197 [Leadbettera azotonutricia ZAS-9]